MGDIRTAEVSAQELGDVLGLTRQRVGQLVEQGVFTRRDARLPLATSVQAYCARLASRGGDDDELRAERVLLIRAQRIRVELDNARKEATVQDLDWQDATVGALAAVWFLKLRPVTGWTYDALTRAGVANAYVLAGQLNSWLVALRHEVEVAMKRAAGEARRKELRIKTPDDLLRLAGISDEAEDAPEDDTSAPYAG